MMPLSARDRQLVERLMLDPTAKPSFEAVKGCLVWPDEVPQALSRAGHEFLNDLLAARGLMHLGKEVSELPEPYRNAWLAAMDSKLAWPGFQRLSLSAADRRYLEDELRFLENSDEGL
jgi:hypothetical protein